MKLFLAKLSLFIASLVLVAALLEGGLRFAGFAPETHRNPIFSWTTSEGELWRLEPDSDWNTLVGGHAVHTNSFGIRDGEIGPKPAGEFRILVLGDSVTFGHGQPFELGFVVQLEKALVRKRPEIRVINAGVPGWSAYQERLFYEEFGEALDPDLVLVGFVLNDIRELRRGLIELSARTGIGLLRVTTWLAERTATVAALKRAYTVYQDPHQRELDTVYDLALHADTPEARRAMELTLGEYDRIIRLTQSRGHGFGLVLFPFRFQLVDPGLNTPQRRIVRFAEEREIPVLDTLPALHEYDAADVLMDADHFTAKGHRVVAEAMARWLEEASLLPVRR